MSIDLQTLTACVSIGACVSVCAAWLWLRWRDEREWREMDREAEALRREAVAAEARRAADRLCAGGEVCDLCPLSPDTCGHAEGGAR